MAYSSSRSGGTTSKFYKCKRCYSANRFCTHSRGSAGKSTYSKRKTSRAAGSYAKKRPPVKKAYKKKAVEPVKIDVPVLDKGKNAVPDMIPMGGVRVRCVRLTDPKPVRYESKKFDGKVCWRGVTDAFSYEMNGEGPFLHRRILFQGPTDLTFDDVELEKAELPSSTWSRPQAVSLQDADMAMELRKMFGAAATVRDLLFTPVKAFGFNIVADTRKQLEGKASGARRFMKFWKGFGKTGSGTVVKYDMSANGETDGSLADDEKYRHIYAMDIFQYGINGLDARIPSVGGAGVKRGADGDLKGKSSKRPKSEDSYDDMMDGLNIGACDAEIEQPIRGVVRVMSNMKLYWYDPK